MKNICSNIAVNRYQQIEDKTSNNGFKLVLRQSYGTAERIAMKLFEPLYQDPEFRNHLQKVQLHMQQQANQSIQVIKRNLENAPRDAAIRAASATGMSTSDKLLPTWEYRKSTVHRILNKV